MARMRRREGCLPAEIPVQMLQDLKFSNGIAHGEQNTKVKLQLDRLKIIGPAGEGVCVNQQLSFRRIIFVAWMKRNRKRAAVDRVLKFEMGPADRRDSRRPVKDAVHGLGLRKV